MRSLVILSLLLVLVQGDIPYWYNVLESKCEIYLNRSADTVFDLIVVGSGLSGGIVATEYARLSKKTGKKIAILEAGDVLALGHYANSVPLSEEQYLFDCMFKNYSVDFESLLYVGYPYYALGGKTGVWGNSCPVVEMSDMCAWPKDVITDLFARQSFNQTYFERASDIMNIRPYKAETPYTKIALLELNEANPIFKWYPNEMALSVMSKQLLGLTTGLWSSIPMVLERALDSSLCLHLDRFVESIGPDMKGIRQINVTNTRTNKTEIFYARKVVIAAGAYSSGRLVHRSNLGLSTEQKKRINKGFTDHVMVSVKTDINPTSPFYDKDAALKIIGRPFVGDTPAKYIVDIALNVNSFININVEYGPGLRPLEKCEKPYTPPDVSKFQGVVVFLLAAPLIMTNNISFDSNPVTVNMDIQPWEFMKAELESVLDHICKALDMKVNGTLVGHPPGYVAHEGGNLAVGELGVLDSNLKLVENVYVCDASIYASILPQNPSHMLAAHAVRLAHRLAETDGRGVNDETFNA